MLCEHCKKREATVKYVEVINGVKTEHNLCAQCASHIDMGQYSALFEGAANGFPAWSAPPAAPRMRSL